MIERMTHDIQIRKVEAGDVDAVESLFEQEAAHNGFSFEKDSPFHPANSAIETVNATLDDENVNCGWIAFSDGQPAGIITTPQDLAGGVFVSDEFRGQGIAQALVKERESYFQEELGQTKIERPIRADNEASLNLHLGKLGYSFTEASQKIIDDNPEGRTGLAGDTVLYVEKSFGPTP